MTPEMYAVIALVAFVGLAVYLYSHNKALHDKVDKIIGRNTAVDAQMPVAPPAAPTFIFVPGGSPMQGVDYTKPLPHGPTPAPTPPPTPSNPGQTGITVSGPGQGGGPETPTAPPAPGGWVVPTEVTMCPWYAEYGQQPVGDGSFGPQPSVCLSTRVGCFALEPGKVVVTLTPYPNTNPGVMEFALSVTAGNFTEYTPGVSGVKSGGFQEPYPLTISTLPGAKFVNWRCVSGPNAALISRN